MTRQNAQPVRLIAVCAHAEIIISARALATWDLGFKLDDEARRIFYEKHLAPALKLPNDLAEFIAARALSEALGQV